MTSRQTPQMKLRAHLTSAPQIRPSGTFPTCRIRPIYAPTSLRMQPTLSSLCTCSVEFLYPHPSSVYSSGVARDVVPPLFLVFFSKVGRPYSSAYLLGFRQYCARLSHQPSALVVAAAKCNSYNSDDVSLTCQMVRFCIAHLRSKRRPKHPIRLPSPHTLSEGTALHYNAATIPAPPHELDIRDVISDLPTASSQSSDCPLGDLSPPVESVLGDIADTDPMLSAPTSVTDDQLQVSNPPPDTYDIAIAAHHIQKQESATWLSLLDQTVANVHQVCTSPWNAVFFFRAADDDVIDIQPLVLCDPTISRHSALPIYPILFAGTTPDPPYQSSSTCALLLQIYHVGTGQRTNVVAKREDQISGLLRIANYNWQGDFRLRCLEGD